MRSRGSVEPADGRAMNHSQIISFIWGMADLIRDIFKRGKYHDVILPLTVLRRLDCVLAPSKRKVLAVQARFTGKLGRWRHSDRLWRRRGRLAGRHHHERLAALHRRAESKT